MSRKEEGVERKRERTRRKGERGKNAKLMPAKGVKRLNHKTDNKAESRT
jgi:hypothetical protein